MFIIKRITSMIMNRIINLQPLVTFLLSFTKLIIFFVRLISYNRNVAGNSIWAKKFWYLKNVCLGNLFWCMDSVEMMKVGISSKRLYLKYYTLYRIVKSLEKPHSKKVYNIRNYFLILKSIVLTEYIKYYISKITWNYK